MFHEKWLREKIMDKNDKIDIIAAILASARVIDTSVEEESPPEIVRIWLKFRKYLQEVYERENGLKGN
jgi:hypothetical protein